MTSRVHDLLRAACGPKAPAHPLRPTAPQLPWLSPPSWAKAAIWVAEEVLRPATEIERDVLDEAAQILGFSYERREIDPAPRGTDGRLDFAELAKRVVEQVHQKDAQAAQYYAHMLGSHTLTSKVDDRATFLRGLDDEIYRLEAGELVTEYGGPADEIETVLWRGEGKKARLGRCIVRMTGSYGIVLKLKGRYQWFAGGRSDVLATIPDAELDDALKIVTACETRRAGGRRVLGGPTRVARAATVTPVLRRSKTKSE